MNDADEIEIARPPCELPIDDLDLLPGERIDAVYTQFKADPELAAQGWERRHTADPARAEEVIQLYRELGFEVRVEALKPSEFTDACQACGLSACHTFRTIYTRKK